MISIEEVKKLATLSRLTLSEDEMVRMQKEMSDILAYVDTLNTVSETMSLDPATQVAEHSVRNVMRADETLRKGGEYTADLLDAAPKRKGNYVEVKKIL